MDPRSRSENLASNREDPPPIPAENANGNSTRTQTRPGPGPGANGDGEAGTRTRDTLARIDRLERQSRRHRIGIVVLLGALAYMTHMQLWPDGVVVQKTILQSEELELIDRGGNSRAFLRMYSEVPVLQLLDAAGKPRISLGLRFDDSPFIDLSDDTGRTRATLEVTSANKPALRLYDKQGNPTLTVNN